MDIDSLSAKRLRTMLRTAMGENLADALSRTDVFEIMVNPDGRVRLDLAGKGRVDTGTILSSVDAERVIRLVASHIRAEVHADSPIVSAELPLGPDGTGGERFEGLLPPVVSSPCFSIRKPAGSLFTVDDYVSAEIMTSEQAKILRRAVRHRENILVVGGTSSGKTTLTNALLAEVAELGERIILIEDTRELRCSAEDVVSLRTRPGKIAMGDLVRSTLRLRPDRIIVGEVRGAEALDLLKAWNTGHPGGITTLHANSCQGALYRLEQLIQEAVSHIPRALIAEAVDIIVFMSGANALSGTRRHLSDITEVHGLTPSGDYDLRSLIRRPEVSSLPQPLAQEI
jgi:P-type conjugative transfer ATPase TrbB